MTEDEFDDDPDYLRQVSGSFLVAAFRKPEFRVDPTLTRRAGNRGHAAARHGQREVSLRRHHGAPAREVDNDPRGGPERAGGSRRRNFPREQYTFGYYPDRANRQENHVAGETVALDATGALTVTVPSDRDVDVPYRYTFEADVEDISRQHIANRTSLTVAPAPWYIGLRPSVPFHRRRGWLERRRRRRRSQRQRGRGRQREACPRSHPVELGAPRRRQRLLHVGNGADRSAVR